MAWQGYFEYDGSEVINVTRFEQYAQNAGLHWFRPVFEADALPYMLGDGLKYTSPLLDDAPWVDPDLDHSVDFLGVYPLDVTGIEDSSRTSNPVESLGEGGLAGALRHATKTLVFNCILVAHTEEAMHYGFSWLKRVLLGGPCGGFSASSGQGATLCYLSGLPDMYLPDHISNQGYETGTDDPNWVPDPEDCLTPFLRSLRKVEFNSGPTVSGKRVTNDGSVIWTVTFSAVAGSPYELSAEVPVIEGLMDPEVAIPWAGGLEPAGAMIDTQGFIYTEEECAVPTYQPIYDPLCPAIVPPPSVPSVPLGCYVAPVNWRRRSFRIPKQFVPLWGEVVPKVEIHAKTDLRNLRLRFYPDPYLLGDASDDPCSYCGDMLVSYIPASHTMVLDGAEQLVYVISPGGDKRRADSLVFKTDGTPFDWPALSCGFGYLVTLDLPQTQEPPVVDLSLFSRAV